MIATILSGVLATTGCTTVTPRVEPPPIPKHRTKVVRTTTAPKVVKQKVIRRKKVTIKKPIKPVQNETPPVIAPLGGGAGGGTAGGGHSW
jgi:hypothetical protein